MRAITVTNPGATPTLTWAEAPDPVAGPDEVLIRVAATAVNRADLLQASGSYPPPPGASEILGLECSGVVAAVGDGVTDWTVGDECCALLSGGGYAELVAVPASQVLPVPQGVSLVDAAALPEVACTVWSNLVLTAHLHAGQSVLFHGGGSGIGTMGIQVAKALGATVVVTASHDDTLVVCAELGADLTINYTADDFVQVVQAALGGVDVILDVVGAKYLQRNISALADGGRVIIIGMQGGTTAELNIADLLAHRRGVIGTALRSRPPTGPGSKAEVVQAVREHLWPMIADGKVRPVIDAVLELPDAGEGHRRMNQRHAGKIVLTVNPEGHNRGNEGNRGNQQGASR